MKTIVSSAAAAAILFSSTYAQGPSWWMQWGVTNVVHQEDDYVVLNQGQLKNFAYGALREMTAKVGNDGPGSDIRDMVSHWVSQPQSADDYAVANLGQLKAVAAPFYQRLLTLGQISELPSWMQAGDGEGEDDYLAANIGQAKSMFSFSITGSGSGNPADELDSDHDGIPDWVEINITHTDPHNADTDGDGVNDGEDEAPNDPTHWGRIHIVVLTPQPGDVFQ